MKLFSKKFIGADSALGLGIISILGGLSQQSSLLSAGIYMVLGSLAYKSAKKRKLGITQPSKVKFIFELIAIALIVVLVLLTNRELLVEDPFVSLIIPIWAVIAYLVISFKK